MEQIKRKNGSRLPRIIKTPSKILRAPLHVCRSNRSHKHNSKAEDTGESEGTSRLNHRVSKFYKDGTAEKRPSNIPRLKVSSREMAAVKSSETKTVPKLPISGQRGNVQRVQLLINPEFGQEVRTQARSVASARPIPTLGQIYGRVDMMDSDRINEWIMTLNPPEIIPETDIVEAQFNNEEDDNQFIQETSSNENTIRPADTYTSQSNLTLNTCFYECLPPDDECTAKDNESGYRSVSPLNNILVNVTSKRSSDSQLLNMSTDTYCLEGSCIPNTEKHELLVEKNAEKSSERSKNNQYPSKADCQTSKNKKNQILSFADCISEILQKTTNFDAEDSSLTGFTSRTKNVNATKSLAAAGCESSKTLSSLAVTDLEIHDDYSSQYASEHADDRLEDHYRRQWCPHCDSFGFLKTQGSQATTTLNEFWLRENLNDSSMVNHSSDRSYRHSYCRHHRCYKSHGDTRLRFRKSKSYRRFPSQRYHLTFPFASLRKRLSMHVCKHKWNRIWKKTGERWATLSRPALRSHKLHVMHYLQRSIIWQNVDVQTSLNIQAEAGTDSALQEQKSAAIATEDNVSPLNGLGPMHKSDISPKDLHAFGGSKRQANLGPSLFTFENNSRSKCFKNLRPGDKEVIAVNNNEMNDHENKDADISHNNVCEKTTASVQIGGADYNRSSNIIAICEVETVDNETDMDKILNLTDKVTSTIQNLCSTPKEASKDAYTEMLVTCNIAAVIPKVKPSYITTTEGTFTSTTNITYNVPCDSKGIMTSPPSNLQYETTKVVPKEAQENATEMGIQVRPELSDKDITINTDRSSRERMPSFVTNMAFSKKILRRETFVQTPPNNCYLCCTLPKLISVSSDQVTSPSGNILKQNDVHTAISAHTINVASGNCMTSPSLNNCTCRCNPDFSTCWTSTVVCDSSKLIPASDFEVFPLEREGDMTFDNKVTSSYAVTDISKKSQGSLTNSKKISTATFTNVESIKIGSKTISTSATQANASLIKRKTESCNHCNKHISDNNEAESKCSTQIGRSRLINVYTMNGAASEAATQTSRNFKEFETYSCMLPKQWKCASVSTSRRCPIETTYVPTGVAADRSLFGDDYKLNCACAKLGTDFGINTENMNPLNLECLTQTSASYLRKVNPTNEFTPTDCTLACQKHLNEINQRLLSLSRLISQRKPNKHIYKNSQRITGNALSSDLNAAKWLKTCASVEKGYQMGQSQPTLEDVRRSSLSATFYAKLPEELKRQIEMFNSKCRNNELPDRNFVVEAAPVVTLSKDSLADVLPSHSSPVKSLDDTPFTPKPDESANKDVSEPILQASPEQSDAATEWTRDCNMNSVYAVTSRIILPSPKACPQCIEPGKSCTECLYVYDKPRCIIHKQNADIGIQKHPPIDNVDLNITPCSKFNSNRRLVVLDSPQHPYPKKDHLKVLPPSVYKALYEVTKLILKDGSKEHLMKNNSIQITNSCGVTTDFIKPSDTCSVAAVTSAIANGQTNCDHNDQFTEPDIAIAGIIDKRVEETTQTNSNCRLQILEAPPGDQDILATHLVASCRCYGKLLTKKLGLVKDHFLGHFPATAEDYVCEIPTLALVEACTMKPSGRGELGCQTYKRTHSKNRRHNSCCFLSPASSLTDICRHDKKHLKSVYYMLSSIEGRLRRLKTNLPISSESFT